jgi:hypothetical protein
MGASVFGEYINYLVVVLSLSVTGPETEGTTHLLKARHAIFMIVWTDHCVTQWTMFYTPPCWHKVTALYAARQYDPLSPLLALSAWYNAIYFISFLSLHVHRLFFNLVTSWGLTAKPSQHHLLLLQHLFEYSKKIFICQIFFTSHTTVYKSLPNSATAMKFFFCMFKSFKPLKITSF